MDDISCFRGEFRRLSNFSPALIILNGKYYPTVEHAFQAEKTLSELEKACIRAAPHPGVAKRLGRNVQYRDDWEEVKNPNHEETAATEIQPSREQTLPAEHRDTNDH